MADMQNKVKSGIDAAADKAKQVAERAGDAHGLGQGVKDQVHGVIDHARDAAHQAAGAVGDYANQAKDRIGDLAGQARDRVRDWTGDAGDVAGQARDRVQHLASDAYDSAGEKLGDFGKEATTLIRRYPLQALLVGFGVGLLLGRAARV